MASIWARPDKFFGWKALTAGKTHYPRIVGFTLPFSTILGSLGSPVTGWIRDSTGSYQLAWELALIILAIGLVSLILARPPVHPSMQGNRVGSLAGAADGSST